MLCKSSFQTYVRRKGRKEEGLTFPLNRCSLKVITSNKNNYAHKYWTVIVLRGRRRRAPERAVKAAYTYIVLRGRDDKKLKPKLSLARYLVKRIVPSNIQRAKILEYIKLNLG